MRYYPAVVEKNRDAFFVFFPDVPGATAADATINGALYWAREILEDALQDLADSGHSLPEPQNIEALTLEEDVQPYMITLVPAEAPRMTKKVTFSIDSRLLGDIDRQANDLGLTRSGFIAEASRRMLSQGEHRHY